MISIEVCIMSNKESHVVAEQVIGDCMSLDECSQALSNTKEELERDNSEEMQHGDKTKENHFLQKIEEIVIKSECCEDEENESISYGHSDMLRGKN